MFRVRRRFGAALMSGVAAALAGAGCALAQEPAAPQEAQAATPQQDSNVTSYPASFFNEFRPNTALQMVTRIPGFSFDGGSGARGFAGNAGNVLIDGDRPASRSDSVGDVLSRIPASSVLRIDLIRGGAPGIDMQGRPVVANVIRKPDAGLTGSVFINADIDGLGYFGRNGNVQVQRQAGGLLLDGSVAYVRDEGGNERTRVRRDTGGAVIEHGFNETSDRFEMAEGTGSVETALFGGKTRLNGQIRTQTFGGCGREILLIPGGENRGCGGGSRDAGEAGLRFTRDLAAGFNMELVAFQSLYESLNRNVSIRPAFTSGTVSESEGGESIGSFAVHSPAFGAWKFDAGSELAFNFVETTVFRTVDGAPLSLAGDSSRVEELRNDTHLVATWTPTATFNVETGLRYEHSTISAGPVEKSLGYVKPRINMSWRPRAGHQVLVRLERIVDQLSFGAFQSSANFNSTLGDTILGVGNNELEPSHHWIFDARYERRWARQGVFVAQVQHREIDDFLGRAVIAAPTATNPNRTFEITRNVGEATRTTYSMSTTVPLDDFGMIGGLLNVGVSLRTSETLDPVVPGFLRRVNGDEPYGWNVNLSRNMTDLNLSWSIYANGGDAATNYNPRSISNYDNAFNLGANFNWRPRPDLTFGGGVNNLGRGNDLDRVIFYTAPRNTGVPDYIEHSLQPGVQSIFLNVRKTFS